MLAPVPHRIHYTLKANSSLGILRVLRELGAGVDVVSGGELHRALRAGFAPARHHLRRRGQDRSASSREALDAGILLHQRRERRRNPSDRASSPATRHTTARRVDARESRDHARHAARLHQDRRQGTQVRHSVRRRRARRRDRARRCRTSSSSVSTCTSGSQLSRIDPYREGTERLASIFAELAKRGITGLRVSRHRRRPRRALRHRGAAGPRRGSPSSCCRRSPRRGSS